MKILEYFVFCSGGSFPIYLEASEIGDHFLIFPDENFIWKGYLFMSELCAAIVL